MLTRRGDRRLLADIVARAREGRLATSTIIVLRPGAADAAPVDAACARPTRRQARGPRPDADQSAGSAYRLTAACRCTRRARLLATPRPAPTPAMVASAAARRAAQVEQASSLKAEAAAHPVDPPLGRFGVRQAFDLIDLLSAFGVDRAFASPSARARQVLAPWAAVGGGSVTLVDALAAPLQDEAGADKDAEARAGRVRAFAAQRLREQRRSNPPVGHGILRATSSSRRSAPTGRALSRAASPAALKHGQILVAHVEHGADGLVVVAVETHSVTTKNPAVPTRKASKRH